jgi:hypothetical protein
MSPPGGVLVPDAERNADRDADLDLDAEAPTAAAHKPILSASGRIVHERTVSFEGNTQAFLDNRASKVVSGALAAPPAERDFWGESLAQHMRELRPAKRGVFTRIVDFCARRAPGLDAGAQMRARHTHESGPLREFLKLQTEGLAPEKDPGRALVGAIRAAAKSPAHELFDRAQGYAATNARAACALLANGVDEFLGTARIALELAGVAPKHAAARAKVIHAGLVAQLACANQAERLSHYGDRIGELNASREPMAERLGRLAVLEQEIGREKLLSPGDVAHVKRQLAEFRSLCEQASAHHGLRIAAAMSGITTATTPNVLADRVTELTNLSRSIELDRDIDDAEKDKLQAQIAHSSGVLTCLQKRPAALARIAGQRNLHSALRALDATHYVKGQRGLDHVLACVGPVAHQSVLQRLDQMITRPDQAAWLDDMGRGDAGIIDMIFPGAEWDDDACRLKQAGVPPNDAKAQTNLDVQHALRIQARELDEAMQSDALKGKPGHAKFPHHAFRALKADAALIAWLANNAPVSVAERNLVIADWISLSLHDPALGHPDPVKVGELLDKLGLQGLDTRDIQRHIRQGFGSATAVLACSKQIQAFGRALKDISLEGAAEHAVARGERVALALLRGIGIEAAHPLQDDIAPRLKALVQKAPTEDLLRTARRIAVLQEAVASGDASFSPSASRGGIPNSVLILKRMAAFGIVEGAPGARVAAAAKHAAAKLPEDSRLLPEICETHDPGTTKNRIASGVKSLFSPASAPAQGGVAAAASEMSQVQKQHQQNAALLALAVGKLKPNEAFAIRFGVYGGMTISAPGLPGVSVGLSGRVDSHNTITVSRGEDDAYRVQLEGGRDARAGVSLSAIRDMLNLVMQAGSGHAVGHGIPFASAGDCAAFLAALANGQEVPINLLPAARIDASLRTSAKAGASVSAAVDFLLASLTAEIAAEAGGERSVRKTADGEIETVAHSVAATAAAGVALAGNVASASVEAGLSLGVQRTLVRQHGMLQAGSSLTVTSKVVGGKVEASLQRLLPGVAAGDRERYAQQLSSVADGSELFVRYQLSEQARRSANMHAGQARLALGQAALYAEGSAGREAAVKEARRHLQDADRVTREPAHYVPEGFGWTLYAKSSASTSYGAYTRYTEGVDAATQFVFFDEDSAAHAAAPGWAARLI